MVAGVGTGPTDGIGDWDVRSAKVVEYLLSVWGETGGEKGLELCKHRHGYNCDVTEWSVGSVLFMCLSDKPDRRTEMIGISKYIHTSLLYAARPCCGRKR